VSRTSLHAFQVNVKITQGHRPQLLRKSKLTVRSDVRNSIANDHLTHYPKSWQTVLPIQLLVILWLGKS